MLFLGGGKSPPQRGYFGCASIRRAPLRPLRHGPLKRAPTRHLSRQSNTKNQKIPAQKHKRVGACFCPHTMND